ncbi:hypothetical protein [Streptomyces sp. NPDC020965]|uniref:hypothetical protein n=1 Tax=Streptomyces sp. NPDC020965 TaxID=3365105 RepID=UPI0037BB71E5
MASIETLERNYLNNPDRNILFALLTDFADSEDCRMPQDRDLLSSIEEGLAKLNTAHGVYGVGPFLHFHRERRWHDIDKIWMGWERKRGKLAEFNRLLSGDESTSFMQRIGDKRRLAGISLVVTLDADSELAPGGIARLVGILRHPLNRASISQETGFVTNGYGVLQPRPVQVHGGKESLFERLFYPQVETLDRESVEPSIHQDFFDSGLFFGKGIYDATIFERSLEGRIPENSVLSHDKLEGFHARTAYISDVTILETAPVNYLAHRKRMHRWVRGDYQLLPWLWAQVPLADGTKGPTKLNWYDRWRLLCDLIGPASGISTFLLFVATLLGVLPGDIVIWLIVLAVLSSGGFLCHMIHSLTALLTDQRSFGGARKGLASFFSRCGSSVRTARRDFTVWLLGMVFMADSALVNLDAIIRAIYRMNVSRRLLLEWVTATEATKKLAEARAVQYWQQMIRTPVLSLVLVTLVAILNPVAIPFSWPVFLIWFMSPQLAFWLAKHDTT